MGSKLTGCQESPTRTATFYLEFRALLTGSHLLLTHMSFNETGWLWGFCHILSDAYFIFMPTAIFYFSKYISYFFQFDRLQSLNKILEAFIYNPVFFISSQKTAISNLLNMSHEQTKTCKYSPVLRFWTVTCTPVFWCLRKQRRENRI